MKHKYKGVRDFHSDLLERLRNPELAAAYIMSAIIDNDLGFLPIALGDVAKAHGMSKLAEKTGINRRTLYKVLDQKGNPSFELVTQIVEALGFEIHLRPKKTKRSKAS